MKRYGLIGHPLSHSFSKGYFEGRFKELDIDAEYVNIDVPTIVDALLTLNHDQLLRGVNVTTPYKTAIIPFLNALDKEAATIGAVNTIRVEHRTDGLHLGGYNTDVIGFRESISPLLTSDRAKALILGTGGAAKAANHVLTGFGIECLTVSRHSSQGSITYSDLTTDIIASHNVIINCTPLGMYPKIYSRPDLPYGAIGTGHLLYDMVYNPMETLFLKAGLERGATVCNGLNMLHLQAEASWAIWNA
jgi:shikimate dehydrogenase